MVRRRARMVLVHIRQGLPMKEPGRHAERRQQPEHTVGGTQTQCAQPTPVSVSQAVVSLQSAAERVLHGPSIAHQGDCSSRASSTDGMLPSTITSRIQQRKELSSCQGCWEPSNRDERLRKPLGPLASNPLQYVLHCCVLGSKRQTVTLP
jgi:hypothetical protein